MYLLSKYTLLDEYATDSVSSQQPNLPKMWKGVFMCFRTFHYNSKMREQSAEVERGYCGCISSLVSVSCINKVGQYSQFVFKSASVCTLSMILAVVACRALDGKQDGQVLTPT